MQVVRYHGRAAVPLPGLFGGFSKVFFVQPETFELYGRVQVIPSQPHVARSSVVFEKLPVRNLVVCAALGVSIATR